MLGVDSGATPLVVIVRSRRTISDKLRRGVFNLYAIRLDNEYIVMNAGNTDYERFSTFEEAVDAEVLYSEYNTEIIDL